MLSVLNIFNEWALSAGFPAESVTPLTSAVSFSMALIVSWLIYLALNHIVIRNLKKLADKTKNSWDNILFEKKLFKRLSHLVPAIIIYIGAASALEAYPRLVSFFQGATSIYMVIIGILVTDAAINSLHEIYNTMAVAKNRSIKGYIQVIKIFLYILGAGIVLSIILNKDLTTFFAGMGAMAAVLMLIFKDSILGFVAGVQLAANDMLRLGDWIQMDSHDADGTVIDMSLITVKVQNWDKTISTIPTYALVSESFTNWRGMEESGGRRIKRAVNIDMTSIRFLMKEEIENYKKIHLLGSYLQQRELEVEMFNREHAIDTSMPVNGRRLTNIGTFRKYIEEYLKQHPLINKNMTFLVRQLQPTDKGLPVEIYVFCSDKRWAHYESVQADIFDHILSVIPLFGLRIFQNPTGEDILCLSGKYRETGRENLVGIQ